MPKVWNKRDPNCPKDAAYVGRPGKWGNPFVISSDTSLHRSRQDCIEMFRQYQLPKLLSLISELQGKDLVCWCAPLPCHADVLLEVANA